MPQSGHRTYFPTSPGHQHAYIRRTWQLHISAAPSGTERGMCTSSWRPDSQAGHATGGQQKATRCTSAAPCPRTLGSLALMATAKVSCILVLRWVPFERRLVDDQEVFYGRRLFSAHARGRQAALTIQRQRLDQQVCLLTHPASVRGWEARVRVIRTRRTRWCAASCAIGNVRAALGGVKF